MKKYATYFLFIISFCTFCTLNAGAQAGKNFSKIGKSAELTRRLPKTKTAAHIEGINRRAAAAARAAQEATRTAQETARAAQAAQRTAKLTSPALQAAPNTKMAQFVTEHRYGLVRAQKLFGISTRKAVKFLKKFGYVHMPPAPRPKLNAEASFSVQDLADLRLSRAEREAAPRHPFQNQRGLIYRGLALNTGDAFRNILENGLLIKDAGTESNTLMLSMTGGMARPSAAARRKITNLTDNSTAAVMWAGKRMGRDDINAVVVVKSQETGDIIITTEDIPAQNIYALTALLRVNGQPAWCKVEMEGEGFRITPYREDLPAIEGAPLEPQADGLRPTPPHEDIPTAE